MKTSPNEDRCTVKGVGLGACAVLLMSSLFPSCKCGRDPCAKDNPPASCNDTDDDDDDGGDDEGGPVICFNPCANNVGRDSCQCYIPNYYGPFAGETFPFYICDDSDYQDNYDGLLDACEEAWKKVNGESLPAQHEYWNCLFRPPCPSGSEPEPTTGEPAECASWNPGAGITVYQGDYYVSAGLPGLLLNDPTILGLCEDFSAAVLSTGGFQLGGLDSGELLYELGLRNGDIPVELNGMPLGTFAECLEAFYELYIDQGETNYELEILRGSSPLTLEYTLVATL